MTKEFETLLYLFGDSANGRDSRVKSIENPDKVIEMSAKQGIWSCIYPVLNTVCDVSKYQMEFLLFVSKGIARNEFTLNILSEAQTKGIPICVVKGVAVASLYASPDYRISSDTDILINPQDEKRLSEFLKSKGYRVTKRGKNDHHMKAVHPVGGLLEVHVSLYSEVTDKVVFGGKIKYNEPWAELPIGKRTFYTLGVNDNLMYLTAHYIKHFVNGGSSIRQMMDLLLYMKKYENKIDFAKYNSFLKELKYDKLISSVKSIGVKYFGMDFNEESESDIESLLEDCEKCGLFGSNSEYFTNVSNIFYQKRKTLSSFKLKFLCFFKSEHTLFSRIFPNQKSLLKMGYKYAENKFLIPFAWIHKIFDFCLKRNKVRNEVLNTDVQNERIETMKKLSIID